MATLNEQLLELARDLRDAEPGHAFTQFKRESLIAWWNEGLCILHRLRPDLFTRSREVTLSPGTRQSVGEGCVLKSVDANLGPDGDDLSPLHRTSITAQRAWTKPACLPQPKDYIPTEWQFDTLNRDVFYIKPPVPLPNKFKVRVVCVEPPPTLTIADLEQEEPSDCWQAALTRHYVLAQAYGLDSDQVNFQLAQWHTQQWAGLFRGSQAADRALQTATIPAEQQQQPQTRSSR
jgi:hypothetical protein